MLTEIAADAIAAMAEQCSNWGRWGADDVLGTANLLTDAKRIEAAHLVTRGVTFALGQLLHAGGPQNGSHRFNPIHVMTKTGLDASNRSQGYPHGLGVADDIVIMPLQCSTQWDGLGHIFDHAVAWNGRPAQNVVTSSGDLITGIQTLSDVLVGRGVLLDVGRARGEGGQLPDGYAITVDDLEATIAAQGASAQVGSGDMLLIRTGHLTRARADGWGTYAGGPAPGLSFWTAPWLRSHDIASVATDTWGVEVRPNEFEGAHQPLHQVVIPHIGLLLGEMWDLDVLAADCAEDGRYDFQLVAQPLPVQGAVGSPVNPIAIK